MRFLDDNRIKDEVLKILKQYLDSGIKSLWQKKAYHSIVECFEGGNRRLIVKDISPWYFDKLNPDDILTVATDYNLATDKYYHLLKALSVPVPEFYHCNIVDSHIFHTFPDGRGQTLDELILVNNTNVKEFLKVIISSICDLLLNNYQNKPLAGLDGKADNFLLRWEDDQWKIKYVDLTPPLCFYKGRHLVHFPNPDDEEAIKEEYHRKYDVIGIIRRLRFSILSLNLDIEPIFYEAMRCSLPRDLYSDIIDQLHHLPDMTVKKGNTNEIHKLVEGLNMQQVDDIREIALRLKNISSNGSIDMSQVFILSSRFNPKGKNIPQADRFVKLKKMLISSLY